MTTNPLFIRISICALLLVSATAQAAPAAAPPLESFDLKYEVRLSGFKVGELKTRLRETSPGHATYEKTVEVNGLARLFSAELRTEKSEVRWEQGRPVALSFAYLEKDGDKEERHRIVFHRDKHTADVWWRSHYAHMQIPPGATDRATLDLLAVVDARERPKEIVYTVVDRGQLKERRFEFVGTERVKTPAGTFDTLVYRVRNPDGHNKEITSWLAKDLKYLPVKIEQRDPSKGLHIVMRLRKIKQAP